MTDTFKGIITADGKKRQLPYGSVLETPVSDATLSMDGAFADAKVVGDKFKEVKAETASLKEDMVNKQNVTNIKFLYESTKNPDDYIAGLASGKMYLLNNGAINPCINIPVFVQKGDLIKSVQCYKKSIKSFNFILFPSL